MNNISMNNISEFSSDYSSHYRDAPPQYRDTHSHYREHAPAQYRDTNNYPPQRNIENVFYAPAPAPTTSFFGSILKAIIITLITVVIVKFMICFMTGFAVGLRSSLRNSRRLTKRQQELRTIKRLTAKRNWQQYIALPFRLAVSVVTGSVGYMVWLSGKVARNDSMFFKQYEASMNNYDNPEKINMSQEQYDRNVSQMGELKAKIATQTDNPHRSTMEAKYAVLKCKADAFLSHRDLEQLLHPYVAYTPFGQLNVVISRLLEGNNPDIGRGPQGMFQSDIYNQMNGNNLNDTILGIINIVVFVLYAIIILTIVFVILHVIYIMLYDLLQFIICSPYYMWYYVVYYPIKFVCTIIDAGIKKYLAPKLREVRNGLKTTIEKPPGDFD